MRGAVLVSIVLAVGCGTTSDKQKASEAKASPGSPTPFADAMFGEVVPLAEGGAYAISVTGGVWYLRGVEAVRVREAGTLAPTATRDHGIPPEGLWLRASLQHMRHKYREAAGDLQKVQEEQQAADEADGAGFQ